MLIRKTIWNNDWLKDQLPNATILKKSIYHTLSYRRIGLIYVRVSSIRGRVQVLVSDSPESGQTELS